MGQNIIHVSPTYVDKVFEEKGFFETEVSTLQLLEANFINNPVIDHYPFPKLISSDVKNYTIRITSCGLNLKQDHSAYSDTICREYLKCTIDCIVNNLKNLFIVHHNIHERNFCINSKGHVHLIDFETALRKSESYITRKPARAKYCLERIENYRDEFKELIYNYIT